MIDWPRAADYLEALQYPEESFADPELAGGTVDSTPLGLPRATSGNVAVVFRVTGASGRAHAVRCFVRSFDDLPVRYDAIAAHLRGAPAPWQVELDYQPDGIRVGDGAFPLVRMAWSEATPLVPWVEAHLWDTAAMSYAASRFVALVTRLREAGVAHGDLQHGNILVAPGGDLRLVDYDGMYVPGLDGLGSNELGHRNYAHPRRTREDFGLHLDAFPSWVVYVSLAALSIDPLLWGRLDGGDECLLFRAADFADPAGSEALRCLERSGDARLAALAGALRSQLARRVDELEPLSFAAAPPPALDLPDSRAAATIEQLRERQSLLEVLRTAAAPVAVAVPSDNVVVGGPVAPRSAVAAAWAGPPPDARVEAAFGPELARHRRSLVAVLAVLAAMPLLGLAHVLPVGVSVAGAVVGLVTASWLVWRQFHELPAVQAVRPQQQALTGRREAAAAARARVDDLVARRAAVDTHEQQAAALFTEAEAGLRHREQTELQRIDEQLRAALSELETREHDLYRAEHHELADALRSMQAQVLGGELEQYRLGTVKAAGMDRIAYSLALDDVLTAADFTDVVVEDDAVVVVRSDGRRVRTSSLAPEQAHALMRWRRSLEKQYEYLLPQRLPAEREAAIREAYAAKRAALEDEVRRTREDAARRAEGVRALVQADRQQQTAALQRRKQEAAEQRLRLDQELGRARKELAETQFLLQGAEESAGVARDLTPTAYIRLLVGR